MISLEEILYNHDNKFHWIKFNRKSSMSSQSSFSLSFDESDSEIKEIQSEINNNTIINTGIMKLHQFHYLKLVMIRYSMSPKISKNLTHSPYGKLKTFKLFSFIIKSELKPGYSLKNFYEIYLLLQLIPIKRPSKN